MKPQPLIISPEEFIELTETGQVAVVLEKYDPTLDPTLKTGAKVLIVSFDSTSAQQRLDGLSGLAKWVEIISQFFQAASAAMNASTKAEVMSLKELKTGTFIHLQLTKSCTSIK